MTKLSNSVTGTPHSITLDLQAADTSPLEGPVACRVEDGCEGSFGDMEIRL